MEKRVELDSVSDGAVFVTGAGGVVTYRDPSLERECAVGSPARERYPGLPFCGPDGDHAASGTDTDGAAPGRVVVTRFGDVRIESRVVGVTGGPAEAVHVVRSDAAAAHGRPAPPRRRPHVTEHGFHGLVGEDPSMIRLYEIIRMVASTQVPVSISGENGTGKELVAGAIHALSARRFRAFVPVHCSAISPSLFESALFGHVKGAFTGADRDAPGFLERAEGGTLFLDEVGDVSPEIQVKLLRLLQSREYVRVGESQTRKADVRLLAATNRDLKELVDAGAMRPDFFYRINVFPLQVPPLRERRSDVPILIGHFVDVLNTRYGRRVRGVSPEAFRVLEEHDWPGNVRELEHVIEHAFVLSTGDELCVEHWPTYLLRGEAESAEAGPASAPAGSPEERARLIEVLESVNWHKAEAAKRLGFSRVTLWKKLQRHGIDRAGSA